MTSTRMRVRPDQVGEDESGIADLLAKMVCEREIDSPTALTNAKRGFFDWLGVTLAGSREPAPMAVLAMAQSQFAAGDATCLVGDGARLSATGAAIVNGTAAHVLDYDDIGLSIGHPSAVIATAGLAVAEAIDASGRELLDAMVVGYEVAHRFAALPPDSMSGPYQRGYHGTSLYGIFGATATAARLLGLSAEQTAIALGMAASESAGLRVNFGTMTKPYHAGAASSSGIRCALLAGQDFTSCRRAIEDDFGWFDVIGRSGTLHNLAAGLDGPFAIEQGLWFKSYPCCGANHYAIDGLLWLREAHELESEDIAEVEVTVHQRLLDDVLVFSWPESGMQGKFCLAYNVTAALVDGRVGIRTFDDANLDRLAADRSRVVIHGVTEGDVRDATVRVRTWDGRRLVTTTTDGRRGTGEPGERVLHGMETDPLTWTELAMKFRDNVDGLVTEEAADQAIGRVSNLENEPSMRPLTAHLRGALNK